jgi:D-3-phosphoglycerate dehydrogenase
MLRRLNEMFLVRDVNIFAQYLETDRDIGYVVLDADLPPGMSDDILDEIQSLDGTIRTRLVYEH